MIQEDQRHRLLKSKLVVLIAMYFGDRTAELYRASYTDMPIEFVEKSTEKLLTEYLGADRARALINEVKTNDL